MFAEPVASPCGPLTTPCRGQPPTGKLYTTTYLAGPALSN